MRQLAAVIIFAGIFRLAAPGQSSAPQPKAPALSPDSGLVLGVEWRRMIDSPVGASLLGQIGSSPFAAMPAFKSFQDVLLHNVDSLTLAIPAAGLKAGIEQPPVLAIVKGRFDMDSLRSLLVKKNQVLEKYNAVELLVPPQSGPKSKPDLTRIALLDNNTIIAGDRTQVRTAIDRIKAGGPALPRTGILAGAAQLAATNELWMIVNIPAEAAKEAPAPMSQMLAGVKSAELGVSFKDGLATQMNFRTKDDAAAQTLAQGIQGLLALAAMSQSQDESSQASMETLKKVTITPVGSLVKLELALDKAEFEKIIQQRKAPARITSAPAPRPVNPARSEPARSNTIRISGLDSGPLEIPMPSK